MILLLLCVILILFIIVTVVFYLIGYKCFKDLKCDGPFPWPIIGNLTLFWNRKKFFKKAIRLTETYGKIIKISGFGHNAVLIFEPELLNFVLNSKKFNEKSSNYEHLKVWLGTGILTSSGNKWKKHRKMLTPIFHFKLLRSYVEVFQSQAHVLTQELQKHANGESFDICPWISSYFLDVFSGTKMNTLLGCNITYHKTVEKLCDLISERSTSLFKFYDFTYKFTRAYWESYKCANIIHEYAYKIIRENKSKIKHRNFEPDEFSIKKTLSFLDLLFNSTIDGQHLSDEDIREEIDSFTFGGSDTGSVATYFAFYEISRNPKIQEDIFQEALTILGENDRDATYDDLQSMIYLEMVIKETLRLYPPAAIFQRIIKEDVKCDWGTLKANTNIIITPYVLHRIPEYFPNPDIFDPSRFSPENLSKIKPWTYMPFSAGHRNCIGQKFAMLVMKSAISQIVMKFKVLPDPNFVPDTSLRITLTSLNGIRIRLEKRS